MFHAEKFYLFKDVSIRFKDYWENSRTFQGLEQIFQFSRTFQGVDAFPRTIQGSCEPCNHPHLLLNLKCAYSKIYSVWIACTTRSEFSMLLKLAYGRARKEKGFQHSCCK